MGYRVTAPYVTVKVSAAPGAALTTLGFYRDMLLPGNVDTESAELLVTKGMVEKIAAPAAAAVDPASYQPDPTGAEISSSPAEPVRPERNASKADWVTFAVSQRAEGISEEQAKADAEAMTKADLATLYGG